jgi:pimeloyl-ACP methyl ester carboxylesterase
MNRAIKTRELITLDGLGVLVRGTYHRSAYEGSGFDEPPSEAGRIGVLFLNSLSIPRTATGDSAVYWADSLARLGYPVFRCDLPGLGDSCGNVPNELLDFMNDGGFGPIASSKAKELVERFNLAGVVIAGHCAGAITAIHAASACPECKGLILMDPYFHLVKANRPKVRQNLSDWARRSKLGALFSNIYDLARDVRLFFLRNTPPGNANFHLLGRWKQVASAGLPILFLKAPGLKTSGTKPRVGDFDYLKYVLGLAGRKSKVVVQFIAGTDHSFANRVGRAAVLQRMESWLATYFPQPDPQIAAMNIASPQSDVSQYDRAGHEQFLNAGCALESRY